MDDLEIGTIIRNQFVVSHCIQDHNPDMVDISNYGI